MLKRSGKGEYTQTYALRAGGECHRGVESLDRLRLRLGRTIRENDAVARELPVARTITEVAAVGQELTARSGGRLMVQSLIDEVPDEAAAVLGVTLEVRVQLQASH